MHGVRRLSRILGLARADDRRVHALTLSLFLIGAALASSWALPIVGWLSVVLVAIALTTLVVISLDPRSFAWLRLCAFTLLVIAHLFWVGLMIVLSSVLAWSVPVWIWVFCALSVIGAVGSAALRSTIRVPLVLPVGIAIATLVGGWMREDGVIRCDDYLRVRASGSAVVVPSTPEVEHCVSGDSMMVERYPRQFWESPRGDGFLVTTQRGDHDLSPTGPRGRMAGVWFSGAVCRVNVERGAPPQCLGDGKSDAIAESPLWDRLYATVHDAKKTTIYVLPRDGSIRPVAEVELPVKAGVLYFDDQENIIGLCEDDALQVYHLDAHDLKSLGSAPAPFTTNQVRYDQRSHEGIACAAMGPFRRIGGQAFAAVAYRGNPFSYRPLASSAEYPSSWLAATWGCDWDPMARRAYVAVASLGLLETIDYDSGRILKRSFIGPGVRSVLFDPRRGLIYAGFFLSGDVIAIDEHSGAVIDRWFAGRFLRQLAFSRDQTSLLVTSILGIVRLPLRATPAS